MADLTLDAVSKVLGAPYWERRSPDGYISIGRPIGEFISTDVTESDVQSAKKRLDAEFIKRTNK